MIGSLLADRYRVGSLLGAGGMGAVYRARHVSLAQDVAIKVMTSATTSGPAVQRFMREARLAAKLRCEHVAQVLDFATLPTGEPFIVLELLEGRDLSVVLQERGSIDVPTAVDWVLQALVAVGEAHAAGIVHRDLKPSNIFLARKPDGEACIKVMDFGLSRNVVPEEGEVELTQSAVMMGTPAYCAPEVLRSARRAEPRSDIFAMGVVLYQLLTGRVPFAGATVLEIAEQIFAGRYVAPRAHVAEIPVALEGIVARCLACDSRDRYDDVADLAFALAPFAPRPELAVRIMRTLGRDPADVVRATDDSPTIPDPVSADGPTLQERTLPLCEPGVPATAAVARRRRGGAAVAFGFLAATLAGALVTMGAPDLMRTAHASVRGASAREAETSVELRAPRTHVLTATTPPSPAASSSSTSIATHAEQPSVRMTARVDAKPRASSAVRPTVRLREAPPEVVAVVANNEAAVANGAPSAEGTDGFGGRH